MTESVLVMMPRPLFLCLVCFLCIESKYQKLRGVYDNNLPINTPTARFFKKTFSRLDEGDVKSLAIVMKDAYASLCETLNGCDYAKAELWDLFELRFNELDINTNKMRKLGFLLQRLIA
jgi:hypothetical protein